jgi:hypothetical protein
MSGWVDGLRQERTMLRYSILMLTCLMITSLLWLFDERMVREVHVWAKPMKFMASTALLALTTALILSVLPSLARRARGIQVMVWVLIVTSAFEVGYISLQGALGQGSHYNVSSPMMAMMFGLMAIAAVGLTATQGYLAWVVFKHGLTVGGKLLAQSVIAGLGLTFVLATVSGFMLGGMQPPAGVGLPIVGWHLTGGDVRPAHFLGVHANQIIPLFGLTLLIWQTQGLRPSNATAMLYGGVSVYVLAWAGLSVLGLSAAR